MEISPIAFFSSPFMTKFGIPRQSGIVEDVVGEVVFEKQYRSPEAVRGLQGFDYIWLIWGFTNPAKYPVNSVITFEAIGDGTDNDNPIKGDERYIPISTWNLVNDYSWGNNGYSASFRITKAGNYSLKVTFQKQIYDGSQWVSTGETAVTQQDFVIAGEGQFTDENGNGTGNTTNPDEVIGGGVKTGDNNPTIILIVVLVAAAVLLVILGVVRRKKK